MELEKRLANCYSGSVYDVLARMGYRNVVLPYNIRPLDASHKIAGMVYTVSGHQDEHLEEHETLLQWTKLLSKAPAHRI